MKYILCLLLFVNITYAKSYIELQNGLNSLDVHVNLNKVFRDHIYLEYGHNSYIQYKTKSDPIFHKYIPIFGFLYKDYMLGYMHISGGTHLNDYTKTPEEIDSGYDSFIDFILIKYNSLYLYMPINYSNRRVFTNFSDNSIYTRMKKEPEYYDFIQYKSFVDYKKYKFEYKIGVNLLPEMNLRLRLYYNNAFYIGYMNERNFYLHDYKRKVENMNLGMRVEF